MQALVYLDPTNSTPRDLDSLAVQAVARTFALPATSSVEFYLVGASTGTRVAVHHIRRVQPPTAGYEEDRERDSSNAVARVRRALREQAESIAVARKSAGKDVEVSCIASGVRQLTRRGTRPGSTPVVLLFISDLIEDCPPIRLTQMRLRDSTVRADAAAGLARAMGAPLDSSLARRTQVILVVPQRIYKEDDRPTIDILEPIWRQAFTRIGIGRLCVGSDCPVG